MEKNLIDWNQDLAADSEEEYQALIRSLQWIDGFGLIFIDSTPAAGRQLIERVQQDVPEKRIGTLALEQRIDNLYNLVTDFLKREPINILFITGLEKSFVDYIQAGSGGQGEYYKLDSVPRILGHLNLQRERFRDNLKICLVFILPFFGLKYFIRRAPDFFDWRSGVFKFSMDAELLQRESLRVCQERWDRSDYLALTPQERQEKLLEIQTLILEEKQTPEQQAELFYEQGLLHSFCGEHQQTIASYDRAVAIIPDFHEAWYNRGLALDDLGRYEEAIASYDRAAIKPDYHQAWYNRGIALSNLRRYEEAIASYDRALEIKPDLHEAWYNRGNALYNLGRYEEAIASYDRAVAIKPDKHNAWYNRGIALSNLRRYEEALTCYDQALEIKPDDHESWNNRGIALSNLGRYEEAIACYDRAVAIKPDLHETWNNRGIALSNLRQYEKAIACYDRAVAIKPDYHQAWNNRGITLGNLGRYEEAIASYDKALEIKPNDRETLDNREIALAKLKPSS